MRHNNDHRKLGRTAAHRRAMLRNMVTSLFERERITTTEAKAREARRLAERMITFARRGDLAARRHVCRTVSDPGVVKKLFDEIGPRYAERPGGYTRLLKTGVRRGDAARTAILELVGKDDKPRGKKKTSRKTYRKVEIPPSPAAAAEKKKRAAKAKGKAEAGDDADEAAAAGAEVAAPASEAGAAGENGSPAGDKPEGGAKE